MSYSASPGTVLMLLNDSCKKGPCKLNVSYMAQLGSKILSNQNHCPNSTFSRVKKLSLWRSNSLSHFHTLIFLENRQLPMGT